MLLCCAVGWRRPLRPSGTFPLPLLLLLLAFASPARSQQKAPNQTAQGTTTVVESTTEWNQQAAEELRPYRLTEKRVHDRGLGKWKRQQREEEALLSADWQWPRADRPLELAKLPLVDPHAELQFHANQSFLHVRTQTWLMRHDECLEVRFRVEGKRTRLLLYTCRMAEGGECVLDKFLATTEHKQLDRDAPSELDQCHKLQPWLFAPSPFSFHVRFVRRPRRFADQQAQLRHWRRRHGRHATREVGRVQLNGFRACSAACGGAEQSEELTDVHLAGADHFPDERQGWRRRRR